VREGIDRSANALHPLLAESMKFSEPAQNYQRISVDIGLNGNLIVILRRLTDKVIWLSGCYKTRGYNDRRNEVSRKSVRESF
jgi:hypothetical protein